MMFDFVPTWLRILVAGWLLFVGAYWIVEAFFARTITFDFLTRLFAIIGGLAIWIIMLYEINSLIESVISKTTVQNRKTVKQEGGENGRMDLSL